MYDLNNNFKYLMTDNCKVMQNKNNTPVYLNGTKIKQTYGTDIEIDKRYILASINNTLDMEQYYYYFCLVISDVQNRCHSMSEQGLFVTHLDLGYIPICMAPTFMCDKMNGIFLPKIKESGVRYRDLPMLRTNGKIITGEGRDIWCSKVDIAEILGKDIRQVKSLDFISYLIGKE